MKKIPYEELFEIYQNALSWIGRIKNYGSEMSAKEAVFHMFDMLRAFSDFKIPERKKVSGSPKVGKDGQEYPYVGFYEYRGVQLPAYSDDNGQSEFISYNGAEIMSSHYGYTTDWYYIIDKMLDKIEE